MVWVGTTDGYLSSFNRVENAQLVPYTSFKCFKDSPVYEIKPHSKGIILLGSDGVRLTTRTGIKKFSIDSGIDSDFKNLVSMASNSSNEIIVGSSSHNQLFKIDILKQKIIRKIPFEGKGINKLACNNKYIIINTTDNSVEVLDTNTGENVKSFTQSSQSFSDFYCKEHTLITCGYAYRGNQIINERFVNIIDLRIMKALPPVLFPAGAAYARLHPKLPSIAIILSQSGLIHFVDIFNQANVYLYQGNVGSYMAYMDVSPTGDFLVFGDSYNNIHLWTHNPNSKFTMYGAPLDYGVPFYPSGVTQFPVDNLNIPLNSIGMPYYKELLLSAWPYDSKWSLRRYPAKIDPEILSNAKQIDNTNIGIAIYDKEKYGPRNVTIPYDSQSQSVKIDLPKFISEKENEEKSIGTTIFDFKAKSSNLVPPCYHRLEILYSKFGVDDFDFDYFNNTPYSGLETHVSNTYCNPLLQLYRFTPDIFNFTVRRLARENLEQDSVTTELGYLFDMLVKSNGRHCNASNFQRVLNSLPEAHRLGLVDDVTMNTKDEFLQRRLIQAFNKFVMERLAFEEDRNLPEDIPIVQREMGKIACVAIAEEVRGLNYQMNAQRVRINYSLDINAPLQARANGRRINLTILNYIEESVNNKFQKTMGPQVMEHYMALRSLPNLLSLNLNLRNEEITELKSYRRWLLPEFYASESPQGTINFNTVTTNFNNNVKRYELLGYVAEISSKDGENHFVSFIKINEEVDGKRTDNWYLFNDFLVLKVSEQEAFNFNYWWKKPVILFYNTVSKDNLFDYDSWKSNMNDEILYRDHFTNAIRESVKIEYKLLTREEAPHPGTLIAIDAEFVKLTKELYEVKSDGSKILVRPSKLALARVSVLRGEGPQEGVPFIDDYITTSMHIEDYVTSFSGIENGDLDPSKSNKPLVQLSTAYRKLWLLLNLGCVFIGHGLSSDFRAINIHVPEVQVRDTAIYFYLKHYKRKLSLKFLTYILLNEKVQTGNHDSIEDARSALNLYKKYLDLEAKGELLATLNWIYNEGRAMKFKPPQ